MLGPAGIVLTVFTIRFEAFAAAHAESLWGLCVLGCLSVLLLELERALWRNERSLLQHKAVAEDNGLRFGDLRVTTLIITGQN